jgi:hypothetical protein
MVVHDDGTEPSMHDLRVGPREAPSVADRVCRRCRSRCEQKRGMSAQKATWNWYAHPLGSCMERFWKGDALMSVKADAANDAERLLS